MNKYLKINYSIIVSALVVIFMSSCGGNTADPVAEAHEVETPVQVSSPGRDTLTTYTELNATSAYLEKSYIKANIGGYLEEKGIKVGDFVTAGQILFTLQTKESQAIGNSINKLDPAFKFSGKSRIGAAKSGFVISVNHQEGDYVQDGEALAVISNQNSLVFLLDMPYEMRAVLAGNRSVVLQLPDGEKLNGLLGKALPAVDSVAQTQRLIVTVQAGHVIPENLIAKARIVTSSKLNARTLPKSAVLSNETEDEFWIMKMINDSTAVKTTVRKGIDNGKVIEILAPVLSPLDRIITVGNYGLADTAKVKIVHVNPNK